LHLGKAKGKMDFDPANRDVPTPRYELESGSEDELEAETSRRGAQESLRLLRADGSDAAGALESGSKLVILVAGAGMALLGSLGASAPAQQYTLQAGGEQHAGVGVVDSTAGDKLTVAVVAPPPSTHSSRFHGMARTLLEATKPSSVVIVDSYSPQDQLHRSAYECESDAESEAPIKYLASLHFLAGNKVDAKRMAPLRAPEAASGPGAAFFSEVSCAQTRDRLAAKSMLVEATT
jgi:hypothetical protein